MKINTRLFQANIVKILWTFAIATGISYVYYTAPPAGYCTVTDSITPDEIFIKKALAETRTDFRKFDGMNYSVVHCCLFYRMESDFFSKLLHRDEGVWVEFAYERNQWAIELSYDKRRYATAMQYFDSCANFRSVTDDTRGPRLYGYQMPNNDIYSKPDKNEIPIIYEKEDLKYFVKWPK